MIGELLAPQVVGVESYGDIGEAALPAEESAAVARAVPSRRAEFATARVCARRAMAQLGLPPVAIPVGRRREPLWPAGVVGSITHCLGYRAAAVGRAEEVLAVGIDAERHAPLPPGVLSVVASQAEQRAVEELAAKHPAVSWDRLLFSAKEAAYKAWFPHIGTLLGFHEAEVAIEPVARAFTATLLNVPAASPALTVLRGRWAARDGLLLTAVTALQLP